MMFIVAVIFQLSSSAVSAIENITLSVPECKQTSPGTGMVSLSYRGTWTNICHYGGQKNWGKREADTACKQLGYEGGWPYDVCTEDSTDTLKLNNFDCDETATNLKDCEYDITYECREAKVAGIQCYNTFEVTLVGGSTPNVGRVEVKYDDVWSSVCYESQLLRWSFANAQVVCRELGFPGTMFAKQGGLEYGNRNSTITGYQCREDLRDKSLGDCYPDHPDKSVNASNSSCGFTPSGVSNDAVAICTVPGYLGCYTKPNAANTEFQKITSSTMTIRFCRLHCRKNIYRYAFLRSGTVCFCSGVAPESPVSDSLCRRECGGNNMEVCGDEDVSSAYDVTTGVCQVTNNADIYYFGDIFNDFNECDNGMEPVDTTPIQCIMGSSPDEFMWNGTDIPECPANEDTTSPATLVTRITEIQSEDEEVHKNTGAIILYMFIGACIVPCLSLVVSVVICLVVRCKRSKNPVPVSRPPDAEMGSEIHETYRPPPNVRSHVGEVVSCMNDCMPSWCPTCTFTVPLTEENVNDGNIQINEDGTVQSQLLSQPRDREDSDGESANDKYEMTHEQLEDSKSMDANSDKDSDNEGHKMFEMAPSSPLALSMSPIKTEATSESLVSDAKHNDHDKDSLETTPVSPSATSKSTIDTEGTNESHVSDSEHNDHEKG